MRKPFTWLVTCLLYLTLANSRLAAIDTISPAEASTRDGENVHIDVLVRSVGTSADGEIELYSEPQWTKPGSVFIRFTKDAETKLKERGTTDIAARYRGCSIRVTGVVKMTKFPTGLHPVIVVSELTQILRQAPVLVLNTGGHTSRVSEMVFTPDGKELISVSDDKTIRVWNPTTGEPIRVLRPPLRLGSLGSLASVAMTRDGHYLAVAGLGPEEDKSYIYLIDYRKNRIERVFRGHENTVVSLAFSPDGRYLFSGSFDLTARMWSVHDGKCLFSVSGHEKNLNAVAFSPDGTKVVTVSDDQTIRLYSATTGKNLAVIKGHTGSIQTVAWSPDGSRIATGGDDPAIRLWDVKGTLIKKLDGPYTFVSSLTFTKDSRELLVGWTGKKDANVKEGDDSYLSGFVNLTTGQIRVVFDGHTDAITDAVLSPDGKVVAATGGVNQEIYLWNAADAAELAVLVGRGQKVTSAGWSPDGRSIAFGNSYAEGEDQAHPLERVFNLDQLAIDSPKKLAYQRGFLELGKSKLEFSDRNSILVKQGNQQKAELESLVDSYNITSATWLTDKRVAVAANSGLYLYDPATGIANGELAGHVGQITEVSPSPNRRFLASSSYDQTIRIWNPELRKATEATPAPVMVSLVNLFFDGEEWIAWTPSGYYACSPGGESLVGWHENGLDSLTSFYPVAHLRKTYYRPDVIKKLLDAGTFPAAYAAANKERGTTTTATQAQVQRPVAAIVSPAQSGTKLSEGRFEVKVAANGSGQPLTTLRLLVDGRPYQGETGVRKLRNTTKGEVKESWNVDLPPGKYRLQVVASSDSGQGTSEEVEVTIGTATNPMNTPAKSANSRFHMLAVGVNAYHPEEIGALDCAVPDSKSIVEAFRNHAKNIYQVEATLLNDHQATRANILKGLDDLAAKAKAHDIAVFYFAGHGDCKRVGAFHILPIDANIKKLAETGISGEEIKTRLSKLPCTALFIMDCCYAGSIDVTSKTKKRALPTETGDLVRELLSEDQGIIVMCGANKEAEAGEEALLGHGYFTKALTEGLSGKAASKRDGVVYLTGLQNYVEERVIELSKGEQTPTMGKPATIRSFPLTKP